MTENNWDYGGYAKNYDMSGEIEVGLGTVKVHNIFEPLPDFMKRADVIFCDPPWNLGNLNSFYTKAKRKDYQDSFERFYLRLFECIDEIQPEILFLEIGKEYLADFIKECQKRYKYVTFYNSMYYNQKKNKCYIIHATNEFKRKKYPLDDMDETDIIKWICANVDYDCIGDLCMGRGTVGIWSNANGKAFVGTELNENRLAVMIHKIEEDVL